MYLFGVFELVLVQYGNSFLGGDRIVVIFEGRLVCGSCTLVVVHFLCEAAEVHPCCLIRVHKLLQSGWRGIVWGSGAWRRGALGNRHGMTV